MPDTREQIIEQMARTIYGGSTYARTYEDPYEDFTADEQSQWELMAAEALPIAVKASTDRVREGLQGREAEFGDLLLPDLRALIRDTHALLDQIDAELGGE